MIVLITNPVIQTYIFSAILLVALLISLRKRQDHEFFPIAVSQELKGFAILTVVFAHVAYALVSDSKFLDPLSTMAGVGVNLFLILSGYGLIISSLKKPSSVWQFYKYRLAKLYVPFWIFLIIFFALDFFVLHLNYGLAYMVQAFFGFFGRANLYLDVNAPFWYFSWIVMYYLIFPWLLIRKAPWLSAIFIYALTYLVLFIQPHVIDNVAHLYRVHLIAFPLGVFLGWLFNYSVGFGRLKEKLKAGKNLWLQIGSSILLIVGILYFAKHSGVGEKPIIEEVISIITSLLLIALFLIKRIEIKTFYWIGLFSYEIYMFHWPLMYRYDFLFKYLPAWLALSLYILVFIGIGWLFKLVLEKGAKLIAKRA